MPVYNGEKYLKEAIDSYLCQTHSAFELIIIDDKSTDKSMEIIHSYDDSRMRVFQNENNKGKSYSLNFSFEIANGKYILLADQDDIAQPDRLEKQISFMEQNQEIGFSGAQYYTFGEETERITTSYPINQTDIMLKMMYHSPFAHPTMIFRISEIREKGVRYQEGIIAEDYNLWSSLLYQSKSANIMDVVIGYRIHSFSLTKTKYKKINQERNFIRERYVKKLFQLNPIVPKMLYSKIPIITEMGIAVLKSKNKSLGLFKNELMSFHIRCFKKAMIEESKVNYYYKQLIKRAGKVLFSKGR